MTKTYERLLGCLECVQKKVDFVPEVALVLGSGLGNYADTIDARCALDYAEIEGFPVSTVSGHRGRFVFGYVGSVPVVVMQGRIHYYEGYSMEDVVLPIRLMRLMGAKILFLTNAAGGVNTSFAPGDFMLITDQIASLVPSPLIGSNEEALGTRFPDMTCIYDRELARAIRDAAGALNIALKEGVYIQFAGPNFESPAEVRMARILGGDAVGMSTGCEAVAARHMGFRVCGVSCISNMASGITGQVLTHEEVKEAGDRAAQRFSGLVTEAITRMGEGA